MADIPPTMDFEREPFDIEKVRDQMKVGLDIDEIRRQVCSCYDGSMEEWKDIFGFEGYYQVSDLGRVRSLDRVSSGRHYSGKILKSLKDSRGYLVVNLCKSGKQTTRTIHSLVVEAFIGPRLKDYEVRHLDGSRDNCHLSNLAYGTKSDQFQDDLRNNVRGLGEDWHISKLKNNEVTDIVERIKSGQKQVDIAAYYNVSPQIICDIKKGRRWAHLTKI